MDRRSQPATFVGMKAVNTPRPLDVQTNRHGDPVAAQQRGWPRRRVVRVQDCWRIDEDWWRETPISRLYYLVESDGEMLLTLYHDLAADASFEQWEHGRQDDCDWSWEEFRQHGRRG